MKPVWEFHFSAPSMWSWRKVADGRVLARSQWSCAAFDDAWNDAERCGLRPDERWLTRWFTYALPQ